MRPSVLLLVFCCAVLAACDKSETPSNNTVVSITDLLPRDNEISGWARGSRAWVARNKDDLQREIDGGFEIYTKNGFVEGALQNYTGTVNGQPGIECDVEVYDQHSAAEADALFDDPEKAFSSPITPTRPPSTKAQIQKDVFSYRMKFTKGKYFVAITIGSPDDKTQEVIEIFATNIAAKIK
ncbi:MAG: hypothetical protein HY962_05480 [Ignavibacteriae bacterium]|nr:hypothetical protein [Ignavibacteriota bacterium]